MIKYFQRKPDFLASPIQVVDVEYKGGKEDFVTNPSVVVISDKGKEEFVTSPNHYISGEENSNSVSKS